MYNTEHGQSEYGREYAKYAPMYRSIWKDRTLEGCRWALQDIHNTLKEREMDGYTGRLYAELDAVRDRLMSLKKEGL